MIGQLLHILCSHWSKMTMFLFCLHWLLLVISSTQNYQLWTNLIIYFLWCTWQQLDSIPKSLSTLDWVSLKINIGARLNFSPGLDEIRNSLRKSHWDRGEVLQFDVKTWTVGCFQRWIWDRELGRKLGLLREALRKKWIFFDNKLISTATYPPYLIIT